MWSTYPSSYWIAVLYQVVTSVLRVRMWWITLTHNMQKDSFSLHTKHSQLKLQLKMCGIILLRHSVDKNGSVLYTFSLKYTIILLGRTTVLHICYRQSSVVCHNWEPSKNSWTDQDAVWDVDLGGPKEPHIPWGFRSPHVKGKFWGGKWQPL